jgi:hypothetical protein
MRVLAELGLIVSIRSSIWKLRDREGVSAKTERYKGKTHGTGGCSVPSIAGWAEIRKKERGRAWACTESPI